ncbi:glycoside hydrolase family 76 protein [Paenarthrobacter sp. PH39-S1]|uniref:glycoside hydrolase family 76 protein n=1 Tax=Paenarthrobacter sp. PH39-S1 TaxID=3046204 RepID=UPI0024BA3D9F|nr:glycoside hydrolase family 76 protein [Paenarthrobacter sp. PH39-S1]MDJ0354845.1 glycoside hydrolase family 76 protein [Paenarthrobacter sp. PH39-S1]
MRTDAAQWSLRAQVAADAINAGFGHRLLGLPGTWLAHSRCPTRRSFSPWAEWNYWWQAHYLDALVDSAWRQSTEQSSRTGRATRGAFRAAGRPTDRADPFLQARRLLRTIRLRNFLRLTNNYYDDMAWLALAAGRMDAMFSIVHSSSHNPGARGTNGMRCGRRAGRVLGTQLARAHTNDLGGGIFWSRKRDYKNTPASGPSALYFARNGQPDRAQSLVDWLRDTLYDPGQGLYLDGVHPQAAGPEIERTIYSYNQGPVLGAMLELGGERNLAHAADLIDAVARQLTAKTVENEVLENDGGTRSPLRLHGGGDGGLFTGILIRYLSFAARHSALPERTRRLAADLVLDTADELWAGRRTDPKPAFSSDISLPAEVSYRAGQPVELSTQLQAWMTFESAFQLSRPLAGNCVGVVG